ncbi:family 43 glycosylhydrolase [Limosilactobacillus kribbianus]|uniref:family 43 glycosylhydrolase n=1 Tax=Limosilactobacillus kribbianus TaxID=2982695 RepID=UPI0022654AA9|nr:family 43 glycosylhydrolase [Limosilactobacillus kribbianus]
MSKIKNPIIPGMAPDPSILRVGKDYYIATSTFHWKPAIQIFHSADLANWDLLGYALKDNEIDLQGTNTPAGIWAPHLSYDPEQHKYWITYCHLQNMAGREFNAESYTICADQMTGPWSKPLYLTSLGFDPSLYHEAGKHYLTVLEWETRDGYQAPGHIVIAEVNLVTGQVGKWHRVTTGFTTRGCVEAPQIYHHGNYYYLMLASGGTGYGHAVEIGRAKNIFGPYEPNPTKEPIITSAPRHLFSLGDPDAGHFEMYNPNSPIQKAGHGSLVETPDGKWYIAHLMSRPLPGTKLNPLGRETGLQQMKWTTDGWLAMADDSNLAKLTVDLPGNAEQEGQRFDIEEYFTGNHYDQRFMTPYHDQNHTWVKIAAHQLRIYGRNSFFSQVAPSIMGTRATSFNYDLQTKVSFHPEHYSESAGAGLYYDSNNWLYARLGESDDEQRITLRLVQAKQGQRTIDLASEIDVPAGEVEIKIQYRQGMATILYRLPEHHWENLKAGIDVTYLSDEGVNGEPGEIGGFTGLFNFIGAIDAYEHQSYGTFDYYRVKNN